MSLDTGTLTLPRPGDAIKSPKSPIAAPSEAAFTETFGALLPPAKFLKTVHGKAAYYELPSSLRGIGPSGSPNRVLLIHGVQTPALGMLPLSRALQALFPNTQFVIVELWGHGLSDTPFLPHEPSLFHALIDAVLDELKWPTVHLVGFSLGGALTVGYVASRPSRVQSYTLVAPAGLIPSSAFSDLGKAHLRGDTNEAEAQKWVLEWLGGGSQVLPTDWKERVGRGEIIAEAVRQWQLLEHLGHMASVLAIMRDAGVSGSNAEFVKAVGTGIPSLAVLGGLDDICTSKQLIEVGFTNVAVVPQVGHEVVRGRPTEVAAFICDLWTNFDKSSGIVERS